ncbi:MAG: M23 family metallopeptidase [Gemmatimonadaceae bacterium]
MKHGRLWAWIARYVPHAVVGVCAITALRLDLPRVRTPQPLTALTSQHYPSQPLAFRQQVDTLRKGETLSGLLARGGAGEVLMAGVLETVSSLDPRRLPSGMAVTMRGPAADSVPTEITLHLTADKMLVLSRTASGWSSEERLLPWRTDTVVLAGAIASTLYEALDESGVALVPTPAARAELAWRLADIFEYRVDMSRELQDGDGYRVLFERSRGPDGSVRVGEVLAARFELSGKPVEAVRYDAGPARASYFDKDGKSMRAAFLRAPLAFRRISSVFGMRKHPILGVWRKHRGTDYAAASGTPVRSVGDGIVQFAGRKNGYGNVVEVRHRNGFVSRYGHLRSFASGIRSGKHVGIGQTVGSVGMTGLATAPHLHFEVLINGQHRDPRLALSSRDGISLPVGERARFHDVRSSLIALMDEEPRDWGLGTRD